MSTCRAPKRMLPRYIPIFPSISLLPQLKQRDVNINDSLCQHRDTALLNHVSRK